MGFEESSLHRLDNLMKSDYYAYVEKIKHNMSRIDIFITFVTLHSIQLTLAISISLISNNRLSRSENLVPA